MLDNRRRLTLSYELRNLYWLKQRLNHRNGLQHWLRQRINHRHRLGNRLGQRYSHRYCDWKRNRFAAVAAEFGRRSKRRAALALGAAQSWRQTGAAPFAKFRMCSINGLAIRANRHLITIP